MTIAELIDYLGQFPGDVPVYLNEEQAFDAIPAPDEDEEIPPFLTLDSLSYLP